LFIAQEAFLEKFFTTDQALICDSVAQVFRRVATTPMSHAGSTAPRKWGHVLPLKVRDIEVSSEKKAFESMMTKDVNILFKGMKLPGNLTLPDEPLGLVIFAHGSGSSRHSPRNKAVAQALQQAQLGTLLFDLLTEEEEEAEAYTRHLRFNVDLLAERLVAATRWAMDKGTVNDLSIGYFGSSTGAAAALVAAAELSETVSAVVSRGGRPDLAGDSLSRVKAATLLIVGKNDAPVIPLNEEAYTRLTCEKAMRLVPGATHLFEEEGKLEMVADMASEWFSNHMHPLSNRV
jgi:dienelactone hydrolase